MKDSVSLRYMNCDYYDEMSKSCCRENAFFDLPCVEVGYEAKYVSALKARRALRRADLQKDDHISDIDEKIENMDLNEGENEEDDVDDPSEEEEDSDVDLGEDNSSNSGQIDRRGDEESMESTWILGVLRKRRG